MDNIEFKDKFIGFVDILGFKKMVEASEAGTGMPLFELLEILKKLGVTKDRERFEKHGPVICPNSSYIQRDLDFRVIPFSDSIIVSSEISPAGVINLVNYCWGAVINLLTKGFMCRGYITRGSIYHTDDHVIGSGYQKAYYKEKEGIIAFKRYADERGTPFVEVDQEVCNYVEDCRDRCVKEMFSRHVKGDGVVMALFPFKRLSHSFVIGGFLGEKFDPEKEKQSNKNMRLWIKNFKERVMAHVDQSDPKALRKAQHYIAALDAQIEVCKKTEEMIDKLNSPYPKGRIK